MEKASDFNYLDSFISAGIGRRRDVTTELSKIRTLYETFILFFNDQQTWNLKKQKAERNKDNILLSNGSAYFIIWI